MKSSKVIFLSILLTFSACSFDSALDTRIAKLGPLALSDSNPYLASNLYFAEKVHASDVLGGFLKYRGLPNAIELNTHFFAPHSLSMFYIDTGESFLVEWKEGETIISGPQEVDVGKLALIKEISKQYHGTPVLLEGGNIQVINENINNNQGNVFERKDEALTNEINKSESEISKIKRLQANPALSQAEITPKGDLVHYVSYEGETLSFITRWYTHDIANMGRIVRLNNIKQPDNLHAGDEIIIPKYLLKAKVYFGEEEMQEFM